MNLGKNIPNPIDLPLANFFIQPELNQLNNQL